MKTSITTPQILSPMPTGNGAYIVHKMLESRILSYRVIDYKPYLETIPPALVFIPKAGKAEIIHTTPDYAIFFRRKAVPLVLTFQNYVLDPWMRTYSSFSQKLHYATDLRLWTHLAVRKSRNITAVSHYTAKLAKRDLNISTPIRVIHNGIDASLFRPKTSTSSRNGVQVFFSGNLTRRKGVHWLPGIAERLGKGIEINYTQGLRTKDRLKKHDGLNPVGAVPFSRMPERYREMDIALLPTVREGLSLSILEAMACGLPIVASNCSSLPELIDHGKGGFLCPVGDVRAFAKKINLLADSPKLRQEMGEYNRSKVERYFSLDTMISKYKALFEEVIDTHRYERH